MGNGQHPRVRRVRRCSPEDSAQSHGGFSRGSTSAIYWVLAGSVNAFSHSTDPETFQKRNYSSSHFTDENTEAPRR